MSVQDPGWKSDYDSDLMACVYNQIPYISMDSITYPFPKLEHAMLLTH